MHTPLTEPHAQRADAIAAAPTHKRTTGKSTARGQSSFFVQQKTPSKRKSNCGQIQDLSKLLLAFAEDCSQFPGTWAKKMVGVRGFEPPASASRTQRSSQTEPHPDLCRCSYNVLPFSDFASHFLKYSILFCAFLQNFMHAMSACSVFTEKKKFSPPMLHLPLSGTQAF